MLDSGGLVAQAVRRWPPTAGVPSWRLGHSMWVSWWTKRGLGRFLPFSPTPNFIPPFSPHSSYPFRFISSALVMVCQAWSAATLATHGPIISGLHRISFLDPTLCWTRVEDIIHEHEMHMRLYLGVSISLSHSLISILQNNKSNYI